MECLQQTLDGAAARRRTINSRWAPTCTRRCSKQTERVKLPVDQIEAAGRADLERNTAALKSECAAYAPKARLPQCVAKMSAHKPQGRTVEAAREQLVMLKDFVDQEQCGLHSEQRRGLGGRGAALQPRQRRVHSGAGTLRSRVASVYNIAPPDPKWSKAEQAAYIPSEATLLFTSVHEVWPGHFLQFLHSNANPYKLEALVGGVCLRRGLGALLRGNDVRERSRQGRSGKAHRPAHRCIAARCAPPVVHRAAYRTA